MPLTPQRVQGYLAVNQKNLRGGVIKAKPPLPTLRAFRIKVMNPVAVWLIWGILIVFLGGLCLASILNIITCGYCFPDILGVWDRLSPARGKTTSEEPAAAAL